jgi:toxin-antitoxin system PIN domain toxin
VGKLKLLDANVWLALAFSGHAHHLNAKKWFEEQADNTCAFCRITQMAFLRHLTNSKIMSAHVQTQQRAWAVYEHLANDPRVVFLREAKAVEKVFRILTNRNTPSHRLWTDSYLAAFAKSSSAQLVSFDQDFDSAEGLDVLVLR